MFTVLVNKNRSSGKHTVFLITTTTRVHFSCFRWNESGHSISYKIARATSEDLRARLPINCPAKTLIRLRGCEGWSESSLGTRNLVGNSVPWLLILHYLSLQTIVFGSIVYKHQDFLKVVVHMIIIDQWNQVARLYEIQVTVIYSRAILVTVTSQTNVLFFCCFFLWSCTVKNSYCCFNVVAANQEIGYRLC